MRNNLFHCRALGRAMMGVALLLPTAQVGAAVTMPSIFGDHMVLQQSAQLPVWGQAEPGEQITVTLSGGDVTRTAQATAGEDGKWGVQLDPVDATGPYELRVESDRGELLAFEDVLAGEVWVCGGQSNMEWSVRNSNNADREIAGANYPQIRIFNASQQVGSEPQADVEGEWQVVTPNTIGGFSAVGYFFGRMIHNELDVPVGLIGSNWGGTPIESWTAAEDLASAGFADAVERGRQNLALAHGNRTSGLLEDTGIAKPDWAKPDLNERGWNTATLPGRLDDDGPDINGVVWYRRTVEIPESLAGQPLKLSLGPIDDFDITWFNGSEVGHTQDWGTPREYRVPAELVKPGRNVIAVRVFDRGGRGGFHGNASSMTLAPADGNGQAISLAGGWKVAAERIVTPDPDEVARLASLPPPHHQAASLYNGMIAPLTPYAVRGFLWYQGENNASRAESYDEMLRAMIANWRDVFAGPEPQPFLIVQLANFRNRKDDPATTDGWAVLREAQRQVAQDENNGLAVAIDIGEADDIHPRNKQEVGRRLALVALRDTYGRDVQAEGPTLESANVEDGQVILSFDNAEGLELRGDASQAFAVGDASGKFVWATPTVEGNTVVLRVDGIAEPAVVRYAWQINPPAPLYNSAGLPASPFTVSVDGQ